jgi:hypothetical protein
VTRQVLLHCAGTGIEEAPVAMKSGWIARGLAGAAAVASCLLFEPEARAFNNCDEGCIYIGYALVTGGGIVSAVASQVTLLQGEPDSAWGYTSLGCAGANAVIASIILIIGAFADDEDEHTAFMIWGGAQMSLAIAGLVSGAEVVANDDDAPVAAAPEGTGASLRLSF